jgi:hypothetical protein
MAFRFSVEGEGFAEEPNFIPRILIINMNVRTVSGQTQVMLPF